MAEKKELFEKFMTMGHTSAWDQNWEQAAGYYRQALELIPNHPMALANLALALFEMKVYDEALVNYQKIASITPQDPLPQEKIAMILERQGKLEEAVKVFSRTGELYLQGRDAERAISNFTHVLSLRPDHLHTRTRLAAIYDRMGRKTDAVSEYLAIASILQFNGDIAKAMQTAEYALTLMPGNVDTQHSLAMLRTNQPLPKPIRPRGGTGPVRMAEAHLLAAPENAVVVNTDPISEARQKALVKLASFLFDQAENNPSAAQDQQASRRGASRIAQGTGSLGRDRAERTRILLHIGQAIESQTQGDDAQAAVELERALVIGLKHPAAFFTLGVIFAKSDPKKALRYLQEAARHPDYSIASFLLLGSLYFDTGNISEAAISYLYALRYADCTTVPADQGKELDLLYGPIIEAQRREADEKALRKICDVISTELMRADWREFLRMARQQLPRQSPDSPLMPLTEMMLESHSSDVIKAMSNIRLLANQNKIGSAIEEAYFALQFAPTYLPLHMQIGELLVQEGRTQEAIQKFLLISDLYSLRGEVQQAIKLLNNILSFSSLDTSVRDKLIALYKSHGQGDEALEQYMSLAEIYYHLADLDNARETYTIALETAQQVSVDRSWNLKILGKIVDIDNQRLDWRQAARGLEQMRNLSPSDGNIRSQLVDLRFKLGMDAEAIKEADSYIAVLESEGKRQKGVEFLENIIAERPDRLEIRKRLADLHTLSGKMDKAVEQLDFILHSFIKSNNITSAKAILKQIISLKPANVTEYQKMLNEIIRKS
jgi:tetratricopeptide (TPR) repeat protein